MSTMCFGRETEDEMCILFPYSVLYGFSHQSPVIDKPKLVPKSELREEGVLSLSRIESRLYILDSFHDS